MAVCLRRARRIHSYHRPRLDLCEDRLSLGDAILSTLIGSAWLGSALAPAFAEPVAAAFASTSPQINEDTPSLLTRVSARQSVEQVEAVRLLAPNSPEAVAAPAADAFFSQPASMTRAESAALTTVASAVGFAPGVGGANVLPTNGPGVAVHPGREAADLQTVANLIQPGTPVRETPTKDDVRANLSAQPLYFEANQGQVDSQVDFLARAPGYTLYVSATQAAMQLELPDTNAGSATIAMQLVGGNAQARGVGENPLSGAVSYFVGNDPSRWVSAASTYAAVRYDDVYAGIGVRYYGVEQQLEYDFLVEPGASPDAVRLAFSGADRLEIDAGGDLVLHAGSAALRQQRPFVYQEVGGTRQEVASAFELREGGQVGFRLGAYDAARPLVIDPTVIYSTYVGGSGIDAAQGIEVDSFGNAYVTGRTTASAGWGWAPLTIFGPQTNNDVFVTKLSPAGAHVWTIILGGSNNEVAHDIALVPGTDIIIYLAGETNSCDYPTAGQIAPYDATCNGGTDAFLTVLSVPTPPVGFLVSSTYLGGSGDDGANGLAIVFQRPAVLTGYTESANFPVTTSALQPAHSSGGADRDAFVTQFNPIMTTPPLDYSTFVGDAGGNDVGRDVVYDPNLEGVYVTGYTDFASIPSVAGMTCVGGFGNGDGWVFKFQGNLINPIVPVWFAHVGDAGYDDSFGITYDVSTGNSVVAVAGESNSPMFTNFGWPVNPYNAGLDAFVARLIDTGPSCFPLDHTFHGDALDDGARGIDMDPSLEVYITGYTEGGPPSTWPLVWNPPGPSYAVYSGNTDAFVAHLDIWLNITSSFYLGGPLTDGGRAIAYEGGHVHVAGLTESVPSTFPLVVPARSVGTGREGFVTKIMVP